MSASTEVARAILDELLHQGVREVVLAPGSRSAPLAFEALRLERAGRLRLHVRIDERSAGYLALGLAKVSGDPVALMCTSGTAVANLAPAVVEASYSAIPLVVVTADRPPESRGIGSPQTIDQVAFFGTSVRLSADLGAPPAADSREVAEAVVTVRRTVARAVGSALGHDAPGTGTGTGPGALPHAGPVHLNVGLRPPLVPPVSAGEAPTAAAPTGPAPTAPAPTAPGSTAPPPRVRRTPLPGCAPGDARELLGEVPARTVILVGDLPPEALAGHQQWLAGLAATCGWPIIAEPSANLHPLAETLAHGPLVLAAPEFLDGHAPDLVLSAGLFGLSRPTVELLRRARRHVAIDFADVGRECCDPIRTASEVLTSVPLAPADPDVDPTWLADWLTADAVAGEAVGSALTDPSLTGAAAVAQVWDAAPEDALLLISASWPVRHLEAFGRRRRGVTVIGNRGANGIDGLVATAWGAALAHQGADGGPALAILGDLAFLHDHNGLLAGAEEARPNLIVIVIDNDGGGIFHQLEQGAPHYAGDFERIFGTPQSRDLVAVATAAGVPAVRVSTVAGLAEAITSAQDAGGVRVVVVGVPERRAEAAQIAAVYDEVAARLRQR